MCESAPEALRTALSASPPPTVRHTTERFDAPALHVGDHWSICHTTGLHAKAAHRCVVAGAPRGLHVVLYSGLASSSGTAPCMQVMVRACHTATDGDTKSDNMHFMMWQPRAFQHFLDLQQIFDLCVQIEMIQFIIHSILSFKNYYII